MKNYKKILLGLIFLSIILIIEDVASFPVKFGLCTMNETECIINYNNFSWGGSFHFLPIYSLLIFIFLLFTPEKFFNAWRWFALIFGIFSFLMIIVAEKLSDEYLVILDRIVVGRTLGILFFIISLIIILFQTSFYFRNKKKKTS